LNLSIESLFFRRLSDLLSALGLMLLLYGFWRFSRSMDFPGEWAVLPVLGAVLIILTGPEGWINRTILSNKIIVWIGLISFPLYLWHWPLLSFARIVESEEPSCNIRTMVVILSFALAWLTYKFIERPIQLSVRNKTLVTVLVLCMAVVGFAGIYAYNCDGLKFRSAEKATTINRFDLPYRESCEKITGETYGDDWCNAGTTTKEPISSVIIGDSFSNSYTPMLKAYFEKVDQNFSFIQFARGQCPSLINYGPTYCQIITAKSFEYIKNSPAVKKVVLAAHWPAYYSGKRNFFQSNHIESAASFKEAFERTIKSYRDLGKEVIVLLATPVGGLPKSCVIRPLRITDRNICNLSIQNALNTDGDYRDYMIPFLDSLNIRYFDPFKYFCNDTECKLTMDGEIFNVDTYHLSVFGGEFLLNRGSGELRNLLSN
ncbi:MAG: acyltransferase family protein, partial [Deltaproteobacteria bacterium]